MVKHTQSIRRQQPTNCLSVFSHFKGLALKGLKFVEHVVILEREDRLKWLFQKENL